MQFIQSTLRLLNIASGLVSEDGTNEEYDRAVVEVVTDFLALSSVDKVDKVDVARLLGVNGRSLDRIDGVPWCKVCGAMTMQECDCL